MRSKLVWPLALVALVSLPGCETISGRFKPPGPSVPLTCPASLQSKVADEPLAPEGIDMASLPAGVAEWWFGDYLPWSRGNALRLVQAQRWCMKASGPPPDPG